MDRLWQSLDRLEQRFAWMHLVAGLLLTLLVVPAGLLLTVLVQLWMLGWVVRQVVRQLLAMLARVLTGRHPLHPALLKSLALCCLLPGLSACGTAPSSVLTCPRVPAELMSPPAQPVPLKAGSPWMTPGATTLRMPPAVPRTARAISA
jgi:hypothetical protein